MQAFSEQECWAFLKSARMTQVDLTSDPGNIIDIFTTGRGFQNMKLTSGSVFHSEPNNAYAYLHTLYPNIIMLNTGIIPPLPLLLVSTLYFSCASIIPDYT